MSFKLIAFALACAAVAFPSCQKVSQAQQNEIDRAQVRDEKRKKAIQLYRKFAKEYSIDDPRAEDAKKRAAALEAGESKK